MASLVVRSERELQIRNKLLSVLYEKNNVTPAMIEIHDQVRFYQSLVDAIIDLVFRSIPLLEQLKQQAEKEKDQSKKRLINEQIKTMDNAISVTWSVLSKQFEQLTGTKIEDVE